MPVQWKDNQQKDQTGGQLAENICPPVVESYEIFCFHRSRKGQLFSSIPKPKRFRPSQLWLDVRCFRRYRSTLEESTGRNHLYNSQRAAGFPSMSYRYARDGRLLKPFTYDLVKACCAFEERFRLDGEK